MALPPIPPGPDITARNLIAAGSEKYGASNLQSNGPQNIQKLVNALLDAENGTLAPNGTNTDRYLLAIVGDSTTAGTRGSADLKINSWPWKALPKMQQWTTGVSQNGYFGTAISTSTLADITTYDPRVTFTGAAAISSTTTVGGYGITFNGGAGTMNFTPSEAYDTIEILTGAGSSGGQFSVQAGTEAATTVVSGASSPTWTKIKLASVHTGDTIVIQDTKGAANSGYISCISCFNSTAPKVMIANCAKAGSDTPFWMTGNTGTDNRFPYNMLYVMRPVAVVINLGINDWSTDPNGVGNGTYTLANYKARMILLIEKFRLATEPVPVILQIPFRSQLSAYPSMPAYIQVIKDLAKQYNLPIIDMGAAIGTWEQSGTTAQPYYQRYVDARHPTPQRGYPLAARHFSNRMKELCNF